MDLKAIACGDDGQSQKCRLKPLFSLNKAAMLPPAIFDFRRTHFFLYFKPKKTSLFTKDCRLIFSLINTNIKGSVIGLFKQRKSNMTTSSQAFKPQEFEKRIIDKAQADATYKQRLLSTPKAVFEEELGQKLPADLEVETLQQSKKKLYLLLPAQLDEVARSQVLSEEELEAVAGGGALGAFLKTTLVVGLGISGTSTY